MTVLPQWIGWFKSKKGDHYHCGGTKCRWRNYDINIIDTPGHVDFTIEVERSLRVLDGAICVFDGVAGVEPQTETVWKQADKYNVPRLCFINKLDRVGASFNSVVEQIQSTFDVVAVPLQVPVYDGDEFSGIVDLIECELLKFDEDSLGMSFSRESIESLTENKEYFNARELMIEMLCDYSDELAELYLEGNEIQPSYLYSVVRELCLSRKIVHVLCGSAF